MTEAARVAVAASRVRREEKWILSALESAGVPCDHLIPGTLAVPGAEQRPPWAVVLNREISLVRAGYLATSMEAAGVRVVNSAAATAICGDKWRTALALAAAGLPAPRTVLATSVAAARTATEDFGFPVVIKPVSSSWGRRVALVRDREAAEAVLDYCEALPGPQSQVLCVQELIDKPGRDIRAVVIGGIVVGAMYRTSAGWRTNVALGAEASRCPVDADLSKLALRAAAATGAEIAGVDLVEDRSGGRYVLEVNDRAEFLGLTSATGVDVALAIANYVKAVIGR
ncbi:MAG TPA: lysine biosynthesis protein LysX [Streptosporangiaceae bacterium]|nr:lysine biosynthesis protein LysX [Streptosporangiaceae bacterium]